jgi:hypothetical protein
VDAALTANDSPWMARLVRSLDLYHVQVPDHPAAPAS